MATTYGFNWSWMASTEDTKKSSGYVRQGGVNIFDFRQPSNGAISSSDLSAFSRSVSQGFQRVKSDWRSYIWPILNSLPSGNMDTRWSTALGKGLSSKIDCFSYGIQGSTLFVFNDASSTKADGRYWHSTDLRPKTIAEKFEDLYQEISEIETDLSASSDVDLDPLWAAIGEPYREGSYVSGVGSLDTRCGTLETYIAQLESDIYDPSSYPAYGLGAPLPYSIAEMLDALLQLHNGTGWGGDPSGISHSAISVAAHTHTFAEVLPPPASSLTQARVGPYTSLENEVLRIRYEIQATRGSASWYTDVNNPWGGAASLGTHIAYVGTGTASTSNPHAVHYNDTGAGAVFNAMRSFTGMSSNSDSAPTYSSVNYVTQGTSLESAIGQLDAAIGSFGTSTVVRQDYGPYDRSGMSVTDRANTPITITHGYGRKPIIQVIDTSPEESDYYGMYSSPTYDVVIDYVDSSTVRIWTEAAIVEVIALF